MTCNLVCSHVSCCLLSAGEERDADYVDIDQHDEYVDPDELIEGGSNTGDPPTPASPSALYDVFKPLPSELYIHTYTSATSRLVYGHNGQLMTDLAASSTT